MSEISDILLERISAGAGISNKRVLVCNCGPGENVTVVNAPGANGRMVGYAHLDETYPFLGYSGEWVKILFNKTVAYLDPGHATIF